MTQETRKDFEPWKVATAYNVQEGLCFKCGKPLGEKYHRHHVDGDHSNNEVSNLELHCASCHGGEAYTTHINQKKMALGNVEAIIEKSIKGEISGAGTEKAIEAIKLQLRLIGQCYPTELEELPPEIRTRNYLVGSGILLKEYEKGVKKGYNMGVSAQLETILPYVLKSVQLENTLKKLLLKPKGVIKDKGTKK